MPCQSTWAHINIAKATYTSEPSDQIPSFEPQPDGAKLGDHYSDDVPQVMSSGAHSSDEAQQEMLPICESTEKETFEDLVVRFTDETP